MPRQPRLTAPGLLHHVIARGNERHRIFLDAKDYEFFLQRFGKLLLETSTSCFAWCLMPNHFHLLIRPNRTPLSTFMRRLMTAHAVHFNRRYRRVGHLFHNRFKSVICEDDPYFLELVRYIHLNPLRSGLIQDLGALEAFPWCGHGALMGKHKPPWQHVDAILGTFASRTGEARLRLRDFMAGGLEQGRRPDLTGDRSVASGSRQIDSTRTEPEEHTPPDPRVLGSAEFVRSVLGHTRPRPSQSQESLTWDHAIRGVARWAALAPATLLSGSKRPPIVRARSVLCHLGLKTIGMTGVKVANQLHMSQPSVTRALQRVEAILRRDPAFLERIVTKGTSPKRKRS